MPAVKPEDRVIQADKELHVSLDIPRHAARQIYLWAQQQPWPEGTDLESPGEYHITLLYTPEGHDENKNAWWLEHLENARVTLDGIDTFPAQDQGYAYVLRLDADDVKEHAEMLQNRAEAWGLPITHFDGGYKPHITVGYGPSSRLTGVKPPNFQFDVGPSSVSSPRIKESAWKFGASPNYYHVAPYDDHTRVMERGIDWRHRDQSRDWRADGDDELYPMANYLSTDLEKAREYAHASRGNIYAVDVHGLPLTQDVDEDWAGTSWYTHEPIGPERVALAEPHPNWRYGAWHAATAQTKQARHPFPHINRWTGLPCNCGWGGSSHKVPNLRKVGGLNVRKLLKDPAKAYRTPEGEAFRQHLARLADESALDNAGLTNIDPIVPYVAQRFRKGDIRLQQRRMAIPNQVSPYQLHAAPMDEMSPWTPIEHRLPQWTQFFEARQHPLRRGVDVMDPDFTASRMNDLAIYHQQALEEARKKERWLGEYGPESDYPPAISHHFGPEAGKYKGWSVVPLDARQAEGDSEAMGHCIGRDDQPYKYNIEAGNIDAYSLRDREGYPHVSWHINPDGQDIGHMQGASGYPKPEYRDLISKFNEAKGLPNEEGGEDELEGQYDDYFTFPEATDQDDFVRYHNPDHMYDYAYENGNIGEDTQLDWNEPDWDSIAQEYLNHGEQSGFHETLHNGVGGYGGHTERFAHALHANFDPADADHHRAVGYWNSEGARNANEYVDTPPLEVNNVEDYHNAVDEGIDPYPDWDSIAQDYLNGGSDTSAYYRNQMTPYNHYFHGALEDQGHTDEMHNALMENTNWEDPDHLEAVQNWNAFPGHSSQQVYQPAEPPPTPLPGQQGLWGEPGQSGGVFSSKPPEPPKYRKMDKPSEHCGNCKMMWKGKCWGFGNVPVEPDMVCDNWFPAEKRSAYSPDEVNILDKLSLTNVAANLHYKFEEGGLDAAGATDYAKRLLKLIGYPLDDITIQAALQAWQQMYPNDRIEDNAQSANNQLNAPTVPSRSWGYGTSSFSPRYNERDEEESFATTQASEGFNSPAHRRALAEGSQGDAEAQVEPYFPTVDDAIEANQASLEYQGQTNHALLRPGVLEGALARPQQHWFYTQSLPQAAAALAHGVGQSQAFEDGNKRTAYWLTHHFLHENGLGHIAPSDDEELADHLIGYGEGTHGMDDTAQMFENRLNHTSAVDPYDPYAAGHLSPHPCERCGTYWNVGMDPDTAERLCHKCQISDWVTPGPTFTWGGSDEHTSAVWPQQWVMQRARQLMDENPELFYPEAAAKAIGESIDEQEAFPPLGKQEKFAYTLGDLTYSFNHTSKETLPQEMRRWESISAEPEHVFADQWTLHPITNEADMRSVGRFMRNCWAGGTQDWIDNKMGKNQQPYSLHDENGLPRAAFWTVPKGQWNNEGQYAYGGRPEIAALFGMRNMAPPTGTYKRLYTDWLGRPTPMEEWRQENNEPQPRGVIGDPRPAFGAADPDPESETFKQRLEEEEDRSSTVPTQVNNPEDHWPTFRDPSKQPHEIEFSNDWTFKGAYDHEHSLIETATMMVDMGTDISEAALWLEQALQQAGRQPQEAQAIADEIFMGR